MTRAKAVVNASPLIFLLKLGRLDLLPSSSLTTQVVVAEIRAGGAAHAAEIHLLEGLLRAGRLQVAEPKEPALPALLGLHAGEASVLRLALERAIAEVVVDDRVAIRAAKALGLAPVSTPFLLLRARRAGSLSPAAYRDLLDRLLGHGYFLSAPLYQRLLEAGER